MSRAGEITLLWGDEERTFRLGIGEWVKVQEKCDAGPAEIATRLAPVFAGVGQGLKLEQLAAMGMLGGWRVHDVREPLYRGLIGGGMEPTAAGKLVRELVDERPLLESVSIAYQVVMASVIGAPDEDDDAGEPPGESEGETAKARVSPEERSPSAPSTPPPASSA